MTHLSADNTPIIKSTTEIEVQINNLDDHEKPNAFQSAEFQRHREQFKKALTALRQGDSVEFKRLKNQLKTYVLYPYLERAELLDNVTLKNREALQTFLDSYQDQPVTDWIRSRFLYELARKNQTYLFLTYYRPTSDVRLQCHWINFRLKTDENKRDIFDFAKSIWLHGSSRPDECDPIFTIMSKQGELTPDLIWQRYILALEQNNTGLMRYLAKQLPNSDKDIALLGVKAFSRPQLLTNPPAPGLDTVKLSEVAAKIYSKKIWSAPDKTLSYLEQSRQHFELKSQHLPDMARNFALALASKGHPSADVWLTKIPPEEADALVLRWKLANELRKENWQELQTWLSKTPPPSNSKNDWLYWQARVESALGNTEKATQLYTQLATKRSYYGFLAAALIGQPPNLENQPYPFDDRMVVELQQHRRIQMAHELWKLGHHLSARREWNHAKNQYNGIQQKHLAAVAHQWGWHEQVIFMLADTGLYDSVDMRFPLAFHKLMAKASSDSDLDLTLSLAIARKESAFMPDAYSGVGARGLMQLMPYTAKYIAKKQNLPTPKANDLNDPELNVTLGTRYLKYLLELHENNQILATASYNAGRHNVARWLPENTSVPADIWIETVPYKETRSYIKNVLAYQQIYRSLLGQKENYFSQLVSMQIGATN
ncbi:MAG: transglycosylase SLT domain-containing protein [Gammaproteobacteria bacterium]|nr:transglycosylase SLT domain-containing protein [Gammaproteobacteria bacterium]